MFPWPFPRKNFYVCFHKLQKSAGIPREEHFGLHAIRKTLGTALWESSPQAAQFALGHSSDRVTQDYYVAGGGLVARALDALPQPAAFAEAMGTHFSRNNLPLASGGSVS